MQLVMFSINRNHKAFQLEDFSVSENLIEL